MGLFDFLKKKSADERENTQEIYGAYDEELKMYASRIPTDQKKEILGYISKNEKIMAVKICREASGSGLKQAKDIVDFYEKYLM